MPVSVSPPSRALGAVGHLIVQVNLGVGKNVRLNYYAQGFKISAEMLLPFVLVFFPERCLFFRSLLPAGFLFLPFASFSSWRF
ncbi:hypothetical protein D9M69_449170 [compost metagenome]